jgi:hypothetical protein
MKLPPAQEKRAVCQSVAMPVFMQKHIVDKEAFEKPA